MTASFDANIEGSLTLQIASILVLFGKHGALFNLFRFSCLNFVGNVSHNIFAVPFIVTANISVNSNLVYVLHQ